MVGGGGERGAGGGGAGEEGRGCVRGVRRTVIAVYYCLDCCEYLCDQCTQV